MKNTRNLEPPPERPPDRELFLQKPLPSNDAAERAALGMTMIDNDLYPLIEGLDPEAFYSPINRSVYKAIIAIAHKSLIDPLTIAAEMEKQGTPVASIGGVANISQMMVGIPAVSRESGMAWVVIIRRQFAMRQLIKACNSTITKVMDGEADIEEVITAAENDLSSVTGVLNRGHDGRPKGFISVKELRPELEQRLTAYHLNEMNLVKTGFPEFDDSLEGGGLQPSGLYYLFAPPKAGKSSITLSFGDYASARQKRTVLVVSAEMNRLQVGLRLLSKQTGIPAWKFRPGMSKADFAEVTGSLDEFENGLLKITDNLFSVQDIRTYALREQDKAPVDNPVGELIVDYQQLITLDNSTSEYNRAAEVAKVSRGLKLLAMEMQIPVVAISILNNTAGKTNAIPTMFDMKESGNLAYDAEVVTALHNPNFIPGEQYTRPEVEDINWHILANRGGPTKVIPLKFMSKFMSFQQADEYEKVFRAATNNQPAGENRPLLENEEELWNQEMTPQTAREMMSSPSIDEDW